jgi:hypothetical protein
MTTAAPAVQPELHAAVRAAYRGAMAARRTDREAFETALSILLEHRPQRPEMARRAVALMLATDPNPLGLMPE